MKTIDSLKSFEGSGSNKENIPLRVNYDRSKDKKFIYNYPAKESHKNTQLKQSQSKEDTIQSKEDIIRSKEDIIQQLKLSLQQ